MHSFPPGFMDQPRPWGLGVLCQRDARLARPLRADGWCVGDNPPYAVDDATDYAIPVHGERRGLPHVERVVRQDLIGDAHGQRAWG